MVNKEECIIITFKTMSDAMNLESKCQNGRIIPVPSSIKAGCGMCFMSKDLDMNWKKYLDDNQIQYEDIHKVEF